MSHVAVESAEGVVSVRLQREEKKNALTVAMYAAMADALEAVKADPAARVVLFTGGPRVFTAGNDLQDFLDPGRDGTAVGRFMQALLHFDKPAMAAVNGYAVGIGTTMLLHCDLVVAATDAKLKMPFVDLGLVPEFGSSMLLPRLVGMQRASALLLMSEMFSGQQAYEFGIATTAAPPERVQEVALEQARRLARKPPSAVRKTKALLRQATREAAEPVIEREAALFLEALGSDEAREAMAATLEKREPKFST